ncbi:MAG: DUF167 domain-containing protein [Edaphobacter sp.]|uniref:DUF167 domain-containing protein n=1 Tax=Edaphobacter sp. TaxID=1934404 RepID=UPI0023834533|nr:DUF167 domain-containing protein [Edaphobacter sp.]MDE1175784.1 DUF167 domain-containing protein [Edaphobacter sp.]
MSFTRDNPDGCTLSVRVHPGAKKTAVAGLHDGALKISLNAPPAEGKANDALIAFIAEQLSVPRSKVALITGLTSRSKTLRIAGKSAAEVAAALSPDQDA